MRIKQFPNAALHAVLVASIAVTVATAGRATAKTKEQSNKPPTLSTRVPAPEKKDVVLDLAQSDASGSPAQRVVGGVVVPAPRSELAVDVSNRVVEGHSNRVAQFSAGVGDLGLALLRSDVGHGANAVVSPYSIVNALGMAHAGAVGHTREQIAGLIEPRSAQGRVLSHGVAILNQSLANTTSGVELISANRIWVGQRFAPQLASPYVSVLKQVYRADGLLVDFVQSEPTRFEINRWVADITKNQIKELLPSGSVKATTKAVLTNAVYFKGKWQSAFDQSRTVERAFKLERGGSVNVPTMSGQVSLKTGVVDGHTIFELPYDGGQFAMLIALPPEGHTLQALTSDITGADIAGWSAQLGPVEQVSFQMPKFKIAPTTVQLSDRLKSLGMVAAFDTSANFSGMTGKQNELALDQIFHSAGVIVDESGSEAVAATAASMMTKSIGISLAKSYKVDRPFAFAIVHKPTSAPVFVGKVANPQLSKEQ